MRKTAILILLASFAWLQSASFAQDYKDSENTADTEDVTPETINKLRPGMELRKIGGINMIVPEGAKIYKQGAMLIMEDDGDYSARRFKDMNNRFFRLEERTKVLEEKNKKLEDEVKELRKEIAGMSKAGSVT